MKAIWLNGHRKAIVEASEDEELVIVSFGGGLLRPDVVDKIKACVESMTPSDSGLTADPDEGPVIDVTSISDTEPRYYGTLSQLKALAAEQAKDTETDKINRKLNAIRRTLGYIIDGVYKSTNQNMRNELHSDLCNGFKGD